MTIADKIQRLNDLTETCKDGEFGYHAAAKSVCNAQLECMFSGYAKQRRHFARALQMEVVRLGGKSADSGSASAPMFRGWNQLKEALSNGESGAIVAACESAEQEAIGAFELALTSDLTGPVKSLVEKQGNQIKEAHAHMQRLQSGD